MEPMSVEMVSAEMSAWFAVLSVWAGLIVGGLIMFFFCKQAWYD